MLQHVIGLEVLPRVNYDLGNRPYLYFRPDLCLSGVTTSTPVTNARDVVLQNLLCSVILSERERHTVPIYISMSKDSFKLVPECYSFRATQLTYRKVKRALDQLQAEGLVTVNRGSNLTGKATSLVPTRQFELLVRSSGDKLAVRELYEKGHVLLRSPKEEGKTRHLIALPEEVRVEELKYNLSLINANSVSHKWKFENRTLSPHTLRYNRVFISDLTTLGRFYADFQGLRSSERKLLTVNGESTVELDYSSVSLSLIYHLEGMDTRDLGDLYLVPGLPREFVKTCIAILLNCSSWNQAVGAIRAAMPECLSLTPTEVKASILAVHPCLARHILCGKGLYLQFLDSEICESILLQFERSRKPILAIHDSFIVAASDAKYLHEEMVRAYQFVLSSVSHIYSGEKPRIKGA